MPKHRFKPRPSGFEGNPSANWATNTALLWTASLAPWFRQCLHFCCPGFESQAHHLCFFQFILLKLKLYLLLEWGNDEKKRKRGRNMSILKSTALLLSSFIILCFETKMKELTNSFVRWPPSGPQNFVRCTFCFPKLLNLLFCNLIYCTSQMNQIIDRLFTLFPQN